MDVESHRLWRNELELGGDRVPGLVEPILEFWKDVSVLPDLSRPFVSSFDEINQLRRFRLDFDLLILQLDLDPDQGGRQVRGQQCRILKKTFWQDEQIGFHFFDAFRQNLKNKFQVLRMPTVWREGRLFVQY